MSNSSRSTDGINPVGAGASLVVLLAFDLIGHFVLIISIYLHIKKGKERNLSPRTGFQLLLYYFTLEFIYSVIVEGLSSLCYLSTSVDLLTSQGLCIFQAWLGSTLLLSNIWIATLFMVERLLVRTRPILFKCQSKTRERLFYACYSGIIVTALVAIVPVTRESSIRTFEPSHSFCNFDYTITSDPLMTSFNICIIIITVILFQVQFYSFGAVLFEEYRVKKAVKDIQKFKYKEQDVSQNQEYWYNRHKHRHSFAGEHEWNFTLMILTLFIWMWFCLFPFLVILIKAQSGGVLTPKASFVAVRMLSIHNAINPYIPILIFSPFRQRVVHFLTCGRVAYSRDDFILSNISEDDVTRNNEPSWWKVIESNQWQTSNQAERHREMTYVYENSIDGEGDSYYDSEYESYTSHVMDDKDYSTSARTNQSSVYYLDQEGYDDPGDNYLLAVPVNKPGVGSGETVERIFILHESSNDDRHGDRLSTSRSLSGASVSSSPKLRKVVQSKEFKEMLQRRRINDRSPRLFKVSDSPLSQSEASTGERFANDNPIIESVPLTPKLKRIVQSSAFKQMLLTHRKVPEKSEESSLVIAEPVVVETDSSSSPENEATSWKAIGSIKMNARVHSSTPKLKAVVKSPEFRSLALQERERERSLKFGRVSKTPDLITVVETKPKENGTLLKRNSPERTNSEQDVELIEISDGSFNSVERQINTPDRINKSKERRRRHHEKGEFKRERRKHRHSLPAEAALLKDVGTKPLQVLGLSPKYNKDKIEENGLFSKGDNRPEVLNALFQKALLVGSSTAIIDEDEFEINDQEIDKTQEKYARNETEGSPKDQSEWTTEGVTEDEILLVGSFDRNGPKEKTWATDDSKNRSPLKKSCKVSFDQLSGGEKENGDDVIDSDVKMVARCDQFDKSVDLKKRNEGEHLATEMIEIKVEDNQQMMKNCGNDVMLMSDLDKRFGTDSLDDDSGQNDVKMSEGRKELSHRVAESVGEENQEDDANDEESDNKNDVYNTEKTEKFKNLTNTSDSGSRNKKNDVIYDVVFEEIQDDQRVLNGYCSSDDSPLRHNVDIFVNSVIEKIMAENDEGGIHQGQLPGSEVMKA